jgi:hypothetical protein
VKPSFFKGAVVGGIAGSVMAAATIAVAGTGVGAVFNLGQTNTVNATSSLSGSVTDAPQLRVTNSGSGPGVHGKSVGYGVWGEGRYGVVGGGTYTGVWARGTSTDPNVSTGVYGESAVGKGVFGSSTSGYGVYGKSTSHAGVAGTSSGFDGVFGKTTSANNAGVAGHGGKFGLWGYGNTGVWGASNNGGFAFSAAGNAHQTLAANGWAKAMVRFHPSGTTSSAKIGACFNSQVRADLATFADCGFSVVEHRLGVVKLDVLGFSGSRFVHVTPDGGSLRGVVANAEHYGRTVYVYTYYNGGSPTNIGFDLILF